ncbi:MAG: bifunctional glutamate N-acetyltransferase/amino-acid acetyltransferase ArgJ [bacterium]|nr:bifunctional glutamate N-acetyltransferase/amino-acid acetyltransferase ArgJ [bacterium]
MSENSFIRKIPGGVCAAGGVRAAAVTAGIKASGRPDMMLLVFDPPAQAAGVFTQNLVVAAPVVLCRERVGKAPLRAVLVNSGNANACTGEQGMSNARHLCAALAERLGCSEAEVVMSSTGLIGAQLPVEIMEAALGPLVNGLGADQGAAAAKAIMTTDTRPKECAVEIDLPGGTVRLGGMSKGAGMIAPNLATMLAYLTTDAAVSSTTLQEMLREACEQTFNCITIDGDTSTNDTVLIAATGVSGAAIDSPGACERFAAALREVCLELALAIVRDGEGVTKVVRVKIGGAASVEDARLAARPVSESLLVKTAIHGELPNWGRLFAAAGRSGAKIRPEKMALRIGGVDVMWEGAPVAGWEEKLGEVMKQPEYEIALNLGVGSAEAAVWTTDLSYDYVRINAEYRT